MNTLAGTLDLLAPHLPLALVGAGAQRRLRDVASVLPAALSSCLYIECRPHHPDAADLIADVSADGRAILAGANPVLRLADAFREDSVWTRIEAMARRWNTPSDALHEDLSGAWLEFDLCEAQNDVPPPSLFVDFASATYRASSVAQRRAPLVQAAHLLGLSFSPRACRLLDESLACLPLSAALLYVGFMLGRDNDAIRLCITGLSRDEIPEYLRTLHWPGDVDRLVDLVESLASSGGGVQDRPAIIHLDLTASLAASIGLEYPLARVPQLSGKLAEAGLLDALVRRGLLSREQCDQLSGWPALVRCTMPHQLWPSFLVRRVNHVKLVQDATGTLTAKVYLCGEHLTDLSSRRRLQ